MNRRKVLLAMVMAPFSRLVGKVEPKPIKTEADMTEAIDRGMAEGLSARPFSRIPTTMWPTVTTTATNTVSLQMTIVGYNNPDNDIVSIRFNGDGE